MSTTLDIVHDLSDSEVVAVARQLFNEVYTHVPYNEVRGNANAVAELDPLVSLDNMKLKGALSVNESVYLGRLLLEQYAHDPVLAPLVQESLEKTKKSDNLYVDLILTLGLVVNLTLLVVTTEVSVKKESDGKITWKFAKKKAEPDLVKAVVGPVVDAVKGIKF